MGRLKQPLEIAKLKGAHKNQPGRYSNLMPTSEITLGNAPNYMEDDAKRAWLELEAYSVSGVLTGSDRFILEIAATLMAQFRADTENFKVGKFSQLIGCLARLGLSPSDRRNLGVAPNKAENPFDHF